MSIDTLPPGRARVWSGILADLALAGSDTPDQCWLRDCGATRAHADMLAERDGTTTTQEIAR